MNTTPPKLHRRSYWVWMNRPANPETTHNPAAGGQLELVPDELATSVEVTYADQLRGELELGKLGLNMETARMHVATVWVWCAMVRLGLYSDKFPAFKNRDLAELEPVLTEDEQRTGQPDVEGTPDPT